VRKFGDDKPAVHAHHRPVAPGILLVVMIGAAPAGTPIIGAREENVMLLGRPVARIVVGLVLALLGLVWTLQGFDVLGQDGGMNGQGQWIVIGLIAVIVGLALATSGYRSRSRF
jgi:hypothetical protein